MILRPESHPVNGLDSHNRPQNSLAKKFGSSMGLMKSLKRLLTTAANTLQRAIVCVAFAIIAVPAMIVLAVLVAVFDREEVQDARREQ